MQIVHQTTPCSYGLFSPYPLLAAPPTRLLLCAPAPLPAKTPQISVEKPMKKLTRVRTIAELDAEITTQIGQDWANLFQTGFRAYCEQRGFTHELL